MRLKTSDQLSSAAVRRPAARAAAARRGPSPDAPSSVARRSMPANRAKASTTPIRSGSAWGSASPSAKAPQPRTRGLGRDPKQGRRIRHQPLVRFARAVPFEHGEFGMVRGATLAVAEHARQGEKPWLAGRQQLLHGEFGRRMEVEAPRPGVGSDEVGPEGFEMRLVARRHLQDGRLGLEEILCVEPSPHRGRDAIAGHQEGAAVGEDMGSPRRRARRRQRERSCGLRNSKLWLKERKSVWCRPISSRLGASVPAE